MMEEKNREITTRDEEQEQDDESGEDEIEDHGIPTPEEIEEAKRFIEETTKRLEFVAQRDGKTMEQVFEDELERYTSYLHIKQLVIVTLRDWEINRMVEQLKKADKLPARYIPNYRKIRNLWSGNY